MIFGTGAQGIPKKNKLTGIFVQIRTEIPVLQVILVRL